MVPWLSLVSSGRVGFGDVVKKAGNGMNLDMAGSSFCVGYLAVDWFAESARLALGREHEGTHEWD